MNTDQARGPLAGVKVLDLSALGPGPFASMILADFGADVLSIRRPGSSGPDPSLSMARGKQVIGLDLRRPGAVNTVRRLAKASDVLLESFRPGVMEKWGLGPDGLMADHPGLIYARLTGWGQSGPYARRAGHDINYLAVAGALGAIGVDEPLPPLALLGDLANGSYPAVMGIAMALFQRERTGRGTVVDIAMADSAAYMLTALFSERETGLWNGRRGDHPLSGRAPFYGCYPCADGGWFAVGAIEPHFYRNLLGVLGVSEAEELVGRQWNVPSWREDRARIAAAFAMHDRDTWAGRFDGVEGCATPVLELAELAADPHLQARGTVVETVGRLAAAPAPRLPEASGLPAMPRRDRDDTPAKILTSRGFSPGEIERLIEAEALVEI